MAELKISTTELDAKRELAAKGENTPVARVDERRQTITPVNKVAVPDDGEDGGNEEGTLAGAFKAPAAETEEVKTARLKKEAESQAAKPKINIDRFKEIYPDIDDEDKLFEAVKGDKGKMSKLEIVAQGDKKLKEDADVKNWGEAQKSLSAWLDKSPEALVKQDLIHKYMNRDGITKEEAATRAAAFMEKQIKNNEEWLADTAYSLKEGIKGELSAIDAAIEKKRTNFYAEIEEAGKDLTFSTPTAELAKKTSESLFKIKDFLGIPLAKDDKEREKLLKEADMSDTEFSKLMNDPENRAKAKLFFKYEDKWTKVIAERNNGKAGILNKLIPSTDIRNANGSKQPTGAKSTGQRPPITASSFRK